MADFHLITAIFDYLPKIEKHHFNRNYYNSGNEEFNQIMAIDNDFFLQKIWGSWTGKIAGGTFGMPVEGRVRGHIQNLHPALCGWSTHHKQAVNDDEQYELISLLALEAINDDEFVKKVESNTLLEPNYLGSLWFKYLEPNLVFTAEKAAFENAKNGVPWKHAGDSIYIHEGKAYGNQYSDWIGGQMKGELYGMLYPAWGWYDSITDQMNDLELLKPCLQLSLQDALIAHRDVAIVGQLWVTAMIAVAITHNPLIYNMEINFPKSKFSKWQPDPSEKSGYKETTVEFEKFKEKIEQIGICSETIVDDINRVRAVLVGFAEITDEITKEDVDLYYKFLDPVVNGFNENSLSNDWKQVWRTCSRLWWEFEGKMITDALSELKDHPQLLEKRMQAIRLPMNIHTLFNNSAILIGLLYGDGDFMQTVRIATECGQDTDCNAGNAGAILGAYLGQNLIPSYVKRFIRGEIIPGIKDWADKSIFNLSNRTFIQAKRFMNLNKN
jgi:ADP-ribosylglycohydrolase